MTFFKTLAQSIYSPSFYHTLQSRPFSSSVWYFVKFALLIAVIGSIGLIPSITSFFSAKTVNEIVAAYPSDLEVTVTEGNVSTNVEEPYFIKNTSEKKAGDPENYLVIDTKSEFTPSQLTEYSTQVLVKKDSVVISKDSGESRIIPLKEAGSFFLSQGVIQGWADKAYPYLIPAAIVVSLLLMLAFFIGELFMFVYFFITAVLVFLIAKLLKTDWDYKRAYQASLHAATLPMIISTIMFLTPWSMPPFTHTILLLLVVVISLKAPYQAAPEAILAEPEETEEAGK